MPSNYNPFGDVNNYLLQALSGAQSRGDKSGATNYSRQLDDLGLFSSLFGNNMNRAYDTAAGNLGQRMYQMRGRAQADAGAMAGSRGLINPSAFTLGAGNQASAPFINALQGLEGQRMFANQDLMRFLLQYLQGQGDRRTQQEQFNEQNSFDWSSLFPAAAQIGAAII